MSETTLNLVAITIFLLTLSIVLGPIVHISEYIPALAIVLLAGVFTTDRFGFDGKGGMLFVDWFAQQSEEHRERVLHHEAAHFLVAHLAKIEVTGYSLTAWDAMRDGQTGQGGVRFDDETLKAQLAQGILTGATIDRYCQVWMAGGAAEKMKFGTIEGGIDDVGKVRSLLRQMKLSEKDLAQRERLAASLATQTLKRNDEAYQALIATMRDRAALADCIAAIDRHLPASPEATMTGETLA
jgi:hypothetical protein